MRPPAHRGLRPGGKSELEREQTDFQNKALPTLQTSISVPRHPSPISHGQFLIFAFGDHYLLIVAIARFTRWKNGNITQHKIKCEAFNN